MTKLEKRLPHALHLMAAASPQGAPESLGIKLRAEFRRHHVQRMRRRIARITALAACAVACAGLVLVSGILRRRNVATVSLAPVHQASAQPQITASADLVQSEPVRPVVSKRRLPKHSIKPQTPAGNAFVALPTFDPAIPIGQAQVVRLEMPGRALRLVGFPVNEDWAEQRIVADVVFAQDGTPYAVRLVQTSQRRHSQ